jgi:hypothetical protein
MKNEKRKMNNEKPTFFIVRSSFFIFHCFGTQHFDERATSKDFNPSLALRLGQVNISRRR